MAKQQKSGRKSIGWLEAMLGTETYRLVKGLLTNPISVIGMILLGLFIFVAVAAPILAPSSSGV